jgi:hypothetical protein
MSRIVLTLTLLSLAFAPAPFPRTAKSARPTTQAVPLQAPAIRPGERR